MSDAPMHEPFDPNALTQEQLMKLMEAMLFHGSKDHKPGTREHAAYQAAMGLVVNRKGQPWWRRALGWLLKKRGERTLRGSAP